MHIQSFNVPAVHEKTAIQKVWVVVGFLFALCGQLIISEPQEILFFKPLADFFIK